MGGNEILPPHVEGHHGTYMDTVEIPRPGVLSKGLSRHKVVIMS